MVNDKSFFRYSLYRSRLPYFERNMAFDTWILILTCNLPIIKYTISNLWLLLHLNYETTSQHPVSLIDSQRRGLHHSKRDCLNHLYYLCEIEYFPSLLLQYRRMYTQYSASKICHCQELIYFPDLIL